MDTKSCPCGRLKVYAQCCQPYLDGKMLAPDAESLMRSRYTAYVLNRMDYLEQTSAGPAKQNFDLQSTQTWNKSIKWLGLTVIYQQEMSDIAKVEFIARFQQQALIDAIHEISDFQRIHNQWFYTGGTWKPSHKQTLGLNAACWCGSLKKFKQCHAKKIN